MFIRVILITCIAFIAFGVSSLRLNARDAATKTEMKTKPADRPKSMDAIKEAIKDLTDDQKQKLEGFKKKAVTDQKDIHESASITWKMSQQRREAYDRLKANGIKGKELTAQANKEGGYTEQQAKAQSKIVKVWNDYRYAIVNVLTAEQQKQLPKWLSDRHAARAKAENEAAAANAK